MLRRLQTRTLDSLRAGQGRPLALVLAALLAAALALPGDGPLPALRLALFDQYQVWLPRTRESGPVQIIAIDEASLKEYGQWPWPRTRLAQLIGRVAAQQPLAIGLDILMPESDLTSPEALASRLPPGALRDELAALPANDEVLANAMRRAPVVLGAAGFKHATATTSDALRVWPVRVSGQSAAALPVPVYPQALASLPLLQAAARGQGLLNGELEKGVVRRMPLVSKVHETLVPSLAMELLRVATGTAGTDIAAGRDGMREVGIGDLHVPTMPDGVVWVNFSAPAPERYLSALDLMQGRVDAAALQNKIVIIAQTGLGLADYKTNARGDVLPGVDVHAQLIESFFDGAFLQRPGWMRWAEVALFAASSLLLVWFVPLLRLRAALPLVGGLTLLLVGAGAGLFARAGLLFDAAGVVVAMALVCLSLLASMLAAAVRDRKRSERALQLARESAARTAGELNAARRIQMASLPQPGSAFPGECRFALDALLEPAREVGGDLYDFFMLDRDRVFFMIGDVSGKGLPASLFMVVAKALSKSIALRGGTDMAGIMHAANQELVRENPEMLFVTSVAGILDASSGEVALCNAGHDAPRRIGADGRVSRLQSADGPPLCVMDDFDYPVQQYRLMPGESLCLTTDGITEAMNGAGELYGNERLDALLAAMQPVSGAAGASPDAIVQAVRDDVRLHVAGAEASDDLTLLVLRWNGIA
jgi:serine phosphatase RsbU (regulator of sigma subunit)/CHASE2 domain-containing sensor protein